MSFLTAFGGTGEAFSTKRTVAKGIRGKGPAGSESADLTVCDCRNVPKKLDVKLARGGEGAIYQLAENPSILVKIYHPAILRSKRAKALRGKIEAMLKFQAFKDDARFAWPRATIFNERGEWIGYAMRRVEGFSIQTLCQPQLVRERIPHWKRSDLVKVAGNFLDGIKKLHKNKILIGDINPGNLMINPKTAEVAFIDCDSYQVSAGGRVHACPVGIPMYLPPELCERGCFADITRTVEQENFSIAIMLYKILVLGRHPFDQVRGSDPVSNLKSGKCPLGTGAGCRMPKGPWFNIWSHLPYAVKSAFIKTFRDGHSAPAVRTSVGEWKEVIKRYEHNLRQGFHSDDLIPPEPKSSEFKGGAR